MCLIHFDFPHICRAVMKRTLYNVLSVNLQETFVSCYHLLIIWVRCFAVQDLLKADWRSLLGACWWHASLTVQNETEKLSLWLILAPVQTWYMYMEYTSPLLLHQYWSCTPWCLPAVYWWPCKWNRHFSGPKITRLLPFELTGLIVAARWFCVAAGIRDDIISNSRLYLKLFFYPSVQLCVNSWKLIALPGIHIYCARRKGRAEKWKYI